MPTFSNGGADKHPLRALAFVRGAELGTIYGIVELFVLAIVPWIRGPRHEYVAYQLGPSLLIIGLYAICGGLLGVLYGLVLPRVVSRVEALRGPGIENVLRAALAITLLWIFSTGALTSMGGRTAPAFYLVFAVALTAVIAVAHLRPSVARLKSFADPWITCFLVLGTTLIWAPHSAPLSGRVLSISLLALVFLVTLAIRRYGRRLGDVGAVLTAFCILLPVVGASGILRPNPPPIRSRDPASSPPGAAPNVILICMDAVRADHLSAYGYERDTSPNLKSFLETATLYHHAVSTGDMTLSSHASMFTGLYATHHRAHAAPDEPWGRPLDHDFETLAEILSGHGFATAAVIANYSYLSRIHNLNQGFEYYDVRRPALFLLGSPGHLLRHRVSQGLLRALPYSVLNRWARDAREINDATFGLLETEGSRDRPLFLFLNYMDAHTPYYSPAPFSSRYAGRDPWFGPRDFENMEREVIALERTITERERAHLISQYDGAIRYLDHHLGRLFLKLKELGLYDNSLIVVTSDHGDSFGEKHLIEHGKGVYEGQVSVPLLVRYPRQTEYSVVEERASGVDLLPTVLDVLGYEIPDGVQGSSLRRLRQNRGRPVFVESHAINYVELHDKFGTSERAIYHSSWKLIEARKGEYELYDLSTDRHETTNLYGTEIAMARELELFLGEWIASADRIPALTPPDVDDETLGRLRSLGYLR